MKQIETQITIDASPENVWQVLTNFDEYLSWNPFIKSIEGNLIKGSKLTVEIQPENMKPQIFKPTVISIEKNHQFSWLGHLWVKGLFDGNHYFELKPKGNKTIFVHGEKFSGIMVPLIISMIGENTKKDFIAMNEALKAKVESLVKNSA